MKQSERFDLIDRVARELQSRFKTYELNAYLRSFGIDVGDTSQPISSKWVHAKGILSGVTLDVLLKVADDLTMNAAAIVAGASLPPKNWEGTAAFRLFISHVSAEKEKAKRLRECLAPYSISAFVAHEDIHPTKEWEQELVRSLHTMDAFLAMHTKGFAASNWTQQEIGFAVCRGVKIISFKMGEDPSGFLARRQALLRNRRSAEEIAKEIDGLLSDDPLTKDKLGAAKRAAGAQLDDEIPF
jgi:hypothetical protein